MTGINNVATTSAAITAVAVDISGTADNLADVVYIYSDTASTATSNYVYVTGEYNQTGASKFVYDGFKAGEATSYTLAAADAGLTEGLYRVLTVANKVATTKTAAVALTSKTGVKVDSGLLMTTTNGDDYVVTAVTSSGSTVEATTTAGTIVNVGSSVKMYEIDTGDNTMTLVEDMSVAVEGAVYVELNSDMDEIANIYVLHGSLLPPALPQQIVAVLLQFFQLVRAETRGCPAQIGRIHI